MRNTTWSFTYLKDALVLHDTGVWGEEDKAEGISVLRSTNFTNDGALDLSQKSYRKVRNDLAYKKKLVAGDILLEKSGGSINRPVGRVCYFDDKENEIHLFGNFISRLRANEKIIIAKYLFWYLFYFHKTGRTNQFQNRTTGIRNLEYKNYLSIQIPIPALSEQKCIVEILDQADALRKKRAEADKLAERIIPALFYKMFGDPVKDWINKEKKPIKSVIQKVNKRNPKENPTEVFNYIDISGIDGEKGKISVFKTLLGSEAPSRARQIIKKNDVLISTVRPYLRATALVPDILDNQICSTGFCVLRSKYEYGFGYLYALTRIEWFTQILNMNARGASYPAVSDKDIFEIGIVFPDDKSELKLFDTKIIEILNMQERCDISLNIINKLFSQLLEKAFSGELTAKWREAHMEELLREMEIQAKYLKI